MRIQPAGQVDAIHAARHHHIGQDEVEPAQVHFGVAALKPGAVGYIPKTLTADVVSKAIHKVHAGGRYLSETLAELLAHERLTDRELQVLRLLAVGLPVKPVADKLEISISSVNTYRGRIFTKLGLRSNAELIRYAIHHGVVK